MIQNCAAPLGTRLWGVGGGHQPQPDTPLALPQPFVLKEFGNPQKKLTHTNALRLYRPSVSYPNCSCTAAALESRCCVPGRPVPACRVSIGASHAQLRLGRTGHGVRIARAPACMARPRPLRPRPDPAHLPDRPANARRTPLPYYTPSPLPNYPPFRPPHHTLELPTNLPHPAPRPGHDLPRPPATSRDLPRPPATSRDHGWARDAPRRLGAALAAPAASQRR